MVHFTIPHVRLVVMIPLLYTKQAEFFFFIALLVIINSLVGI